MQHVVERIGLLRGGQRTPGPVVLLARGPGIHPEKLPQKPVEGERGDPEEARGNRRVEEIRHRETVEPLEIAEIVVGGVEHLDHARVGEERREGGQGGQGEGVGEVSPPPVIRHLDEAELDGIVMEAVGFRVDAERLGSFEGSHQRVYVRGGLDPERCGHGPRLYYRVRPTHRRAK